MLLNFITSFFLIIVTICHAAQDGREFIQQVTLPPLEDTSRSEVNMAVLWRDQLIPIEGKRRLQVQILKPKEEGVYPVIIFSGGWSVNFRHYSQILEPLAAKGYVIVNIDHYYQKDTAPHSSEFDCEVKLFKEELIGQDSKTKEERFNRTKVRALDIYYHDAIFILQHLRKILEQTPQADLSCIALMGHSLGGNTGKKLTENLEDLQIPAAIKTAIKACVSLDSGFNQLNAKPVFDKPTLLLGAAEEYKKSDPLRDLRKQQNFHFIMLPRASHVSFVDYVIYPLLKMDTRLIMLGLNSFAIQATEKMTTKVTADPKEFFNGNAQQLSEFLRQTVEHIDQFLKDKLSTSRS